MREGDESVLKAVSQEYEAEVRGRLRERLPHSLQDADLDDVFSIALYRLWNYRARYDASRSPVGAWLYRLARSAAFDLLRRRPAALTDPRILASSYTSGKGTPEATVTPQLRAIEEALQRLSDIDRRIVTAFAAAVDERLVG